MTLIEVLVAVLVLVVGLLAVADGLNAAQRGTTGGETAAVLDQAGEQALQAIEAYPYADIADSSTPVKTTTTDTTNPTYYLSACSGPSGECFQWDPSTPANTEPVDVDTTNGLVAPLTTEVVPAPSASGCTPTTTTNCRMTLSVYAFVTDVTDSVCSQSEVFCPTSPDYKRVTVAVKNARGGSPKDPIYFSTFVTNKVGQAANPLTQPGTTCTDGTTSGVQCLH